MQELSVVFKILQAFSRPSFAQTSALSPPKLFVQSCNIESDPLPKSRFWHKAIHSVNKHTVSEKQASWQGLHGICNDNVISPCRGNHDVKIVPPTQPSSHTFFLSISRRLESTLKNAANQYHMMIEVWRFSFGGDLEQREELLA